MTPLQKDTLLYLIRRGEPISVQAVQAKIGGSELTARGVLKSLGIRKWAKRLINIEDATPIKWQITILGREELGKEKRRC